MAIGVAIIARRQVQVLLQMRREQRPDRVVDHEAARHPQARGDRVAEHVGLKMANSGARTSFSCSRCNLRFFSQTSGSFTYLRTQTTASAGRMPSHQQAAPADRVDTAAHRRRWTAGSRCSTSLAARRSSSRASAPARIPSRAMRRPAIPPPCRCRAARGTGTGT